MKRRPAPRPTARHERSLTNAGPAAEQQLQGFIARFSAENQAVIRAVRRRLRGIFPTANELVYDNYNFFVIGYSPNERPSDAFLSIAAAANGVALCFLQGAKLQDPRKVLAGSGHQVRSLRQISASDLDRPEVVGLMHQAAAFGGVPLAARGPSRLIIRSISKKRRPRRR